MPQNTYKGSATHFNRDDLPTDVQEQLSATFAPDVVYGLLRDAYYRGPIRVGKGGEQRMHGKGTPGTGLRRPSGPLYDYPETWRQSCLRKALDCNLLVQVTAGPNDTLDAAEARYAATERGRDLLFDLDRCQQCNRVRRPRIAKSFYQGKPTSKAITSSSLITACPAHGPESSGGAGHNSGTSYMDYERPDEEVEQAQSLIDGVANAVIYQNDSSLLDANDPAEAGRIDLQPGDKVTVANTDEEWVVVGDAPEGEAENRDSANGDRTGDDRTHRVFRATETTASYGHNYDTQRVTRENLTLVAEDAVTAPEFEVGSDVPIGMDGATIEARDGDYYLIPQGEYSFVTDDDGIRRLWYHALAIEQVVADADEYTLEETAEGVYRIRSTQDVHLQLEARQNRSTETPDVVIRAENIRVARETTSEWTAARGGATEDETTHRRLYVYTDDLPGDVHQHDTWHLTLRDTDGEILRLFGPDWTLTTTDSAGDDAEEGYVFERRQ